MRTAISAVVSLSGLVLLALAFYGQPAVYLHQVRQQWDALMDRPTGFDRATGTDQPNGDLATNPDNDAGRDRTALLQREILRLRAELAARRALEQSSDPTGSADPQSAPPGPIPSLASRPSGPLPPLPGSALPARPAPSDTAQSQTPPAAVEPSASTATMTMLPLPPAVPDLAIQPPPPAADGSRAAMLKPDDRNPPPLPGPRVAASPSPASPAIPPAERRETGVEAAAGRPDTAAPPRSEIAKAEPAKPAPPKQPAVKPILLVPPPQLQAAPSRPEADNAQAILARIRQGTPDPALAQQGAPPLQATLPQQPAPPLQAALPQQSMPPLQATLPQQATTPPQGEPKPRLTSASSLPRLNAARAALAAGKTDEARRLLQEAQLQLVFRPVEATADDPPSAGRGAADVAHALEALSANDVPSSRQYIDIAIDDLSGNKTNGPAQDSGRRASGYAPAYPPR